MVNNHVYALRLHPNQDLKQEIGAFAKANNIQAGYIITCVGSLKKANLRFANQPGPLLGKKTLKLFLSWVHWVQIQVYTSIFPYRMEWVKILVDISWMTT